jgi:hypothetical protein
MSNVLLSKCNLLWPTHNVKNVWVTYEVHNLLWSRHAKLRLTLIGLTLTKLLLWVLWTLKHCNPYALLVKLLVLVTGLVAKTLSLAPKLIWHRLKKSTQNGLQQNKKLKRLNFSNKVNLLDSKGIW